MTPAPVIRLHPDDGVLIARSSLPPGMAVADGVTTVERIPAGHKVAIKPIAAGEPIRRYGQIIGFATVPIAPGQHVHTQNCGMGISPRTTPSASTSRRCRTSICLRPSTASAVPTAGSRPATISAS